MQCPKCGKKVRPSARFCENCGKTLQGSAAQPRDNFERYENYRREHARMQKARERKAKKRKRNLKILAVILLLAAAVCTAAALEHKTREKQTPPAPSETVSPTPSASAAPAKPTKIPSKKKPAGVYDDISEECIIYQNKDKGIDIPYPKSMTQPGESNDKTQKSVRTEDGEAKMIISAEKTGKEMTATQLLSTYKSGIGVDTMYSEVGDNEDYYYIDFERGGEHKHRLGILKDGYHIFYDFSYKTSSESVSKYIEYIAYIDDYVLKKAKTGKDSAAEEDDDDKSSSKISVSDEEDDGDSGTGAQSSSSPEDDEEDSGDEDEDE